MASMACEVMPLQRYVVRPGQPPVRKVAAGERDAGLVAGLLGTGRARESGPAGKGSAAPGGVTGPCVITGLRGWGKSLVYSCGGGRGGEVSM